MSASAPISSLSSIRVSPHSYFVFLFVATFFAAFVLYLGYDLSAAVLVLLVCPAALILMWRDRLVFDGKRLRRTGLVPRFWSYTYGLRDRLKLSDIEQVETQAVRALKRGGRVYYRYRTSVRGKGVVFSFASGNGDYLTIVKAILPKLPADVLDNRSLELRDYLADRRTIVQKARSSNIPTSDVLENAFSDLRSRRGRGDEPVNAGPHEAEDLRRLANELRLSGSLWQAVETFRRAARFRPKDGWLLFEFARCLQSLAGSERDHRLERRAAAMMRLSERRAHGDPELLARLGENYFQIGDWRRAGIVFGRALEGVGESFRALRGMAEIALREGKIAHVIHNFSAASEHAETPSLRRWTQAEVEYFSRLNDDEEYMELEVSRVSLLDSLTTARRTVLRLASLSFPAIPIGLILDDALIANIAWAICGISILAWVSLMFVQKLLAPRIPFEVTREDQ
jgi:tetratricopeptide (TPR) repeat protein